MEEIKIKYGRVLQISGDSISLNLPSSICRALNWEKGKAVVVMLDQNKKGQPYVAIFEAE